MKKILFIFAGALLLTTPHISFAENVPCSAAAASCTCTDADGTSSSLTDSSITDSYSCASKCNDLGAASYELFCDDSSITPTISGNISDYLDELAALVDVESFAKKDPVIPALNVPIPGLDLAGSVIDDGQGSIQVNMIGLYVNAIFSYGITLTALFGVLMLTIAGFQYMTAAGNKSAVSKAKTRMQNVVFGLVILMAAYAIAFLIDPRTTYFNSLSLQEVPYIQISTENTDRDIAALSLPDPSGGTNGIPYFSQRNYSQVYGSSCEGSPTIAQSGCGPTSAAMVLEHLGVSTDPADVAAYFEEDGYRICNAGTAYAAFSSSKIITDNGLVGENIPLQNHAKIEELLSEGHPIIISVGKSRFTSGGHFMVLTGINADGTFALNDPNSGYKWATKDEIYAAIKFAVYIH